MVFLLVMLLLFYLAPPTSALVDMKVGIRKAKERGEVIESDKLKLTPKKIANYLFLLFALTIVDVVLMVLVYYLHTYYGWERIPILPIFSALGSVGECAIEVKSIYEKNDVKMRKDAKDVAKMAAAIVKARGEFSATADAVVNYINEKENEDGTD